MNKDTFECCLAFVVSHGVKRVDCRLLRLDLAVPPPLIGKARFVSTEPKQVAPQGRTKRKPAKVSRGAGNQHGLRAVAVHAAREALAAAAATWTIAAGEALGCANAATTRALGLPPAGESHAPCCRFVLHVALNFDQGFAACSVAAMLDVAEGRRAWQLRCSGLHSPNTFGGSFPR